MKIVCLKGGLGNQLFEYCCYRQLSKQSDEPTWLYYDRRKLKQHDRLILSDCFDVELPKPSRRVTLTTLALKGMEWCRLFPKRFDTSHPRCVLYDDYCQHRRYLGEARQWLRFRPLSLTDEAFALERQIQEAPYPVSVHVRRGDYLLPANARNFGTCTESYYQAAVQHLQDLHPEATFFFFSDDIAWTKAHLSVAGRSVYVQPDSGPDYIDLYLMTQCCAHVIANSTFSFWGAFLSRDAKAPVVYPKQWFKNPDWTVPDIFPNHWHSM